jgi:solute carrier family 25 protein 33/36
MWFDFVAGGTGGCVAAVCTCPLEVLKTRLQSSIYAAVPRARSAMVTPMLVRLGMGEAFKTIVVNEGLTALWKGIIPSLMGVLPARAVYFGMYANVKRELVLWNGGKESSWIHLTSAAASGITTATMTCPFWVVKTRMQLQSNVKQHIGTVHYKNTFHCFKSIYEVEGLRALYSGLCVSYLGVAEGTLQFVLYEKAKQFVKNQRQCEQLSGGELFALAGASKMIASVVTYPHEVLRTRQREKPNSAYKSIIPSLRKIVANEGYVALYHGMVPHLMRTVPNSAIMFLCYELVIDTLCERFNY